MHQETDYRLYLVYRIKVITNNGDPYEFYNYWCFNDVSILPDGTCTCNLDDYETCQDKVLIKNATPNVKWNVYYNDAYYRGYNTLDAVFNQQIAKYIDLYDYETTVNDGATQSVTGNDDVNPDMEKKQDTAATANDGSTQAAAEKAAP